MMTDESIKQVHDIHCVTDRAERSKGVKYKSHVARVNQACPLSLIYPHAVLAFFFSCSPHLTPPRLIMSQGTSDSSSGGRGELPGQAGAGHGQTAERGGRCSAGAGQENHRAASAAASAAAKRGKEDLRGSLAQIPSSLSPILGL